MLASNNLVNPGTWLLRLEPDNTWTFVQKISTVTGSRADVKVVDDVVHILLHSSGSTLVSLEYDRRVEDVSAVE